MDFNIENDRSTDADVGWYVNHLTHNAEEISGILISTIVFAKLFSTLMIKKSLQMLRESRYENLKILIVPLIITLSSIKFTGTVSTVLVGVNNSHFLTKINFIFYDPKMKI